jgi:3-oxoacyl-[acyl-carrier protein] reductase
MQIESIKMKIMLITGASRGLGAAFVEEFKNDYKILTVHRSSGADFRGDLADETFRKTILENVTPDVFISNAGIAGLGLSFTKVQTVNYIAAADLIVGFYEKMIAGHIISVCSTSANLDGYTGIGAAEISYNASKAALQRLTRLQESKSSKPIKITSLEPSMIMTDMANIKNRAELKLPSDYITAWNITPMDPAYVAQTVRWILNQPDNITIKTLEISNFKSRRMS